jgi:hypothetical protein
MHYPLDNGVETSSDGVRLGQEVAIFEQLSLGNVGESGEQLLVLGVRLQEAARFAD